MQRLQTGNKTSCLGCLRDKNEERFKKLQKNKWQLIDEIKLLEEINYLLQTAGDIKNICKEYGINTNEKQGLQAYLNDKKYVMQDGVMVKQDTNKDNKDNKGVDTIIDNSILQELQELDLNVLKEMVETYKENKNNQIVASGDISFIVPGEKTELRSISIYVSQFNEFKKFCRLKDIKQSVALHEAIKLLLEKYND